MSVQAVSWVFDHSCSRMGDRLVLLSIANHARADGTEAWPTIPRLAQESGLSERQVRRAILSLEQSGELVIDRKAKKHGRGLGHIYSMPMTTGQDVPQSEVSPPDTVSPSPEGDHRTSTTQLPDKSDRTTGHPVPLNRPEPSEPSSSNGFRRRERTVIKDALVQAAQWEPENMTARAWGRVEEAAKDLHSLPTPPSSDDIQAFALFWEQRWGEWPTPQAVSGNWADYKAGKLFIDRSRRGARR